MSRFELKSEPSFYYDHSAPLFSDEMMSTPVYRNRETIGATVELEQTLSSWLAQSSSDSLTPEREMAHNSSNYSDHSGLHYHSGSQSSKMSLPSLDTSTQTSPMDYYSRHYHHSQCEPEVLGRYSYANDSTPPSLSWGSQRQSQHQYQQHFEQEESLFVIKHSPKEEAVFFPQTTPDATPTLSLQQYSPELSNEDSKFSPSSGCGNNFSALLTPTAAPIKKTRSRQKSPLSHSAVERRYREGLNAKIDLLHRVLEHAADQQSMTLSECSSVAEDAGGDLQILLDENMGQRGGSSSGGLERNGYRAAGGSNATKARKADVLASAIDYVKKSEREKTVMSQEIEIWKRRVAALQDPSHLQRPNYYS